MRKTDPRRLMLVLILLGVSHRIDAQTLERFAVLPADSFASGPTSGQLIPPPPPNGRVPPFVDEQPIQGFSSLLGTTRGDFLAMPDNGFGAKENSPDYVLRVYRISPEFRTKHGGSGEITVKSYITLRDPNRKINFPIVADGDLYPGSSIPVDARIRRGRWLTGGDFDIESVREAKDGTLWFGDEFGPFLIQTDRGGYLRKFEAADLLKIDDPHNLSELGPAFRFPFQTIESVMPLGRRRLAILNDNNYPFSSARVPGQPDPNEFIVVRLDRPIESFARPRSHHDDEDRDQDGRHR